MLKPFFALLIILSYSFSDVKKEYPTDTLPDPLMQEESIDLTEEQIFDTLSNSIDSLSNIPDTISVASIPDSTGQSDTLKLGEDQKIRKGKEKITVKEKEL